MLNANVRSITADAVQIEHNSKVHTLPNDAVIVNAGGILPTGFLKELGMEIQTKFGQA